MSDITVDARRVRQPGRIRTLAVSAAILIAILVCVGVLSSSDAVGYRLISQALLGREELVFPSDPSKSEQQALDAFMRAADGCKRGAVAAGVPDAEQEVIRPYLRFRSAQYRDMMLSDIAARVRALSWIGRLRARLSAENRDEIVAAARHSVDARLKAVTPVGSGGDQLLQLAACGFASRHL
ncbi:hypothetical protein AB2M62_07410 [Sphingomonas sp. MMS12-HWE2-04]|uniref:hypothetical protein n=1 Tax=Sphingomonas sp. MMS12-HWE2-04 TaxID=3234199 RepID=UPI0038502177